MSAFERDLKIKITLRFKLAYVHLVRKLEICPIDFTESYG